MERVHYRRYTPSRRSLGLTANRIGANRIDHPERRAVSRESIGGYGAAGSANTGSVDTASGAGGSSGGLRFMTQAVISAIILAAVMGLGLLDNEHTAEIRARIAAVLSYQIGAEQLTENLQVFLAEHFSFDISPDVPPEMLPAVLPEEEAAEYLPAEDFSAEVPAEGLIEVPIEIPIEVPPEVPVANYYEEFSPAVPVFAVEAPVSAPDIVPAAEISWLNPLQGYITSLFGPRINPVTGGQEFHNGIDIAATIGTPVLAVRDATVAHVGYTRLNGHYMRIVCNEGYDIVYAHLDEVLAEPGARVRQGEKIAYSGNTGLSTGPHLHFGIFKNGEMLDPLRRVDLPMSDAAALVYAAR